MNFSEGCFLNLFGLRSSSRLSSLSIEAIYIHTHTPAHAWGIDSLIASLESRWSVHGGNNVGYSNRSQPAEKSKLLQKICETTVLQPGVINDVLIEKFRRSAFQCECKLCQLRKPARADLINHCLELIRINTSRFCTADEFGWFKRRALACPVHLYAQTKVNLFFFFLGRKLSCCCFFPAAPESGLINVSLGVFYENERGKMSNCIFKLITSIGFVLKKLD